MKRRYGEIHDRTGILLAENRPAFALALTREDCYDIPATLAQVSAWLEVPLEKVTSRYEQERVKGRKFDPIILFTDIPFEKIAGIEAELIHWPGLQVIARSLRHYQLQKRGIPLPNGILTREELVNTLGYGKTDRK